MVTYLERQEIKLNKLKQKHSLSLERMSLKLTQNNDEHKEERIVNKRRLYQRKEERFWNRSLKQDTRNKNRIWEIDLLRSIVIIGMLIDHLFISFGNFFPKMFVSEQYSSFEFLRIMQTFGSSYSMHPVRVAFRFIGVIVLIMLIGINTSFSKSNLKRGLILLGIGLLESAFFVFGYVNGVTNLTIMGTITTFALCLLIYCGIEAIFSRFIKAWKWICLGIGITILVGFIFVRYSFLGESIPPEYNNFWLIYNGYYKCISYVRYPKDLDFVKVIQHIFGITYFGSDYLGLFPYLGYLFIGVFIGQTLYKDKKSILHYFDKEGSMTLNEKFNIHSRVVLFFGKHSLWFYLLHTPTFVLLMLFIGGIILRIPYSFI